MDSFIFSQKYKVTKEVGPVLFERKIGAITNLNKEIIEAGVNNILIDHKARLRPPGDGTGAKRIETEPLQMHIMSEYEYYANGLNCRSIIYKHFF